MSAAPSETTVRLAKLDADIETLHEAIKSLPRNSEQEVSVNTVAEFAAPRFLVLAKSRGDLVQEREEILEERRVQDVVLEAKEMGWSTSFAASLGECPICLDRFQDGKSYNEAISVVQPCCLKKICVSCRDNLDKHLLNGKCPLCRQELPVGADAKERMRVFAEEGNPFAQFVFGNFCKEAGDDQSAIRWRTLAAEQGEPLAQYELGECYHMGFMGLPKSDADAKKYLLEAAKQGLPAAQFRLGRMLVEDVGPGDDRNEAVEALRWFTLSAAQGYEYSFSNVGWMHAMGSGGLPQSLERGIYWYTKAAKTEEGESQFNLSELMLDMAKMQYGRFDLTGYSALSKSTYWLRKAFLSGYKRAKENLEKLEYAMKLDGCNLCRKPWSHAAPKRCSKCKIMYYCSKNCQLKHWRMGHKVDCLDESMK